MTQLIRLMPHDALRPGQFKSLSVDGNKILLANVDGEYFAIEDQCSHEDSPLSLGCLKGDLISCTLHGSRFCVRDGKPMEEPATESVKTFALTLDQGQLYITID